MKNILRCLTALMFLSSACCVMAQENPGLDPMESVVGKASPGYVIVRNDESRRNVFTLRSENTLSIAFDRKFDKYLDTYSLEGFPFLAIANWNPAFDYLWSAWALVGGQWQEILGQPVRMMRILQEDGKPDRILVRDMNDEDREYTFEELIAGFLE